MNQGARTDLSDLSALKEKILETLSIGCTRRAAAAAAGISDRTLRTWIANDPVFEDACHVAEGDAEGKATAVIWAAIEKKLTSRAALSAAMFWLRCRAGWRDGEGEAAAKKAAYETLEGAFAALRKAQANGNGHAVADAHAIRLPPSA